MNVNEREELLRSASEAYYNGTPTMSDAEYDRLWRDHVEDRKQSPDDPLWKATILDMVGAKPQGFRKVAHLTPMLSLDNVFVSDDGNLEELDKWLFGVAQAAGAGEDIVFEPKIDGLSVSLVYEKEWLVAAVTRGDGTTGDDVFDNVVASNLVPLQLEGAPQILEVRGEVFMDSKRVP